MMDSAFIELPLKSPLSYHSSGKFEAPSSDWIHEDFDLCDFELILMTEGTLYLEYHDIQYTIKEGEFLLLPPFPAPDNRRKGFQASDCSFYWMHFLPAALHQFLTSEDVKNPYDVADKNSIVLPVTGAIPNPGKLLSLMKQLHSNVRLGYKSLPLNYEASNILCELYAQMSKTVTDEDELSQKQIYSDIVDYIKQNNNTNLRVSDVASHFRYNEKYLSHLFTRISGIPLKQFIIKTKMDEASFLLTDTNLNINEISARLGYTDVHNFTRAYKKYTGIAPTAYRQAYSKRLLFHV